MFDVHQFEMRKFIPSILVAVFAAWVLSALHHGLETGFHTREFGKLPRHAMRCCKSAPDKAPGK
jgi:hypothetical protein